jgi:hypothetical protein
MFVWLDLVYAIAGGALVWGFKDKFVAWGRRVYAWWKGTEDYAVALENKAKALQAKAAAIKAAVAPKK